MLSEFKLLLFLAEKCWLAGSFKTSTGEIAFLLSVSQQTISRKLRKLERKGLIERSSGVTGVEVSLTLKGREVLRETFVSLGSLFGKNPASLNGKVASGIGEGAYYVNQYRALFKKSLGFIPFSGTLNLEVKRVDFLRFISGLQPIPVNGFNTRERSFGALKCYGVTLKGKEAFLIVPERTRHAENIIELVSPTNLRKKFGLKNNEAVKISRRNDLK